MGASFIKAQQSRQRIFLSSGTFVVPVGVTKVLLTMIGGGGAGGAATGAVGNVGNGGNSGYSLIKYPFTVTPGASLTVTIGSGGTGVNSLAGNNGGTTSFDSVSVSGGLGGEINGAAKAAIREGLGISRPGIRGVTGTTAGDGGSSFHGSGGVGLTAGHANGASALANTGAGGAGATNDNSSTIKGGDGGSGLCIVEW